MVLCADRVSVEPILADLQVDNASDNKSRFVLGSLHAVAMCCFQPFTCLIARLTCVWARGWLVKQGIVNQVEMVMLPVGHTHEDIDQVYQLPLCRSVLAN